jgi:ribosome-binding factor A
MEIIREDVRDPRVSTVTVTRVETNTDLYHARIFLTSIQPEAERASILEGLEAAAPFIRSELAKRLTIRRIPELSFRWDQTLDHARRIEQLLSEVLPPDSPDADRDPDPDADFDDS